MTTALGLVANLVPTLLELAVLVVGLVLVGGRTTGSRRSLGLVGLVILTAVAVLRGAYSLAVPYLYRSLGLGGDGYVLVTVISTVLTIGYVVGLVFVVLALIARDHSTAPGSPPPTYR